MTGRLSATSRDSSPRGKACNATAAMASGPRVLRLVFLKPVAMPGGKQAVHEPWRNLHAQIEAAANFDPAVDLSGGFARHVRWDGKPLVVLERMLAKRVNVPLASSCGRLFDAAAAALGLCFDRQAYEGEAAACLETVARQAHEDDSGYQLALLETGPPQLTIDPAPLWYAMLADLDCGVSRAVIALPFISASRQQSLRRSAT
jgi:hydrogenase maturation protein HypF